MDTDRENTHRDGRSSDQETLDFHEQVARLAYALWQERGCPEGTPEVDWYRAEQQIQIQAGEKKPAGSTDERLASVVRRGRRAAGSA
jgi:hypothetical protein